IESPKANEKIRTGITNHTEPVESKSSRPDRCPSWNTHTSAPKLAPSDSTFISSALTGTTTEPVMRNSSTKVASATNPRTKGSRDSSAALSSTVSAARPVTKVGNGVSTARMTLTSRNDAAVSATDRGTTSMRTTSPALAVTSSRTTPGRDRSRSTNDAYAESGTPSVRTATTRTGSSVNAG